MILNMPIGIRLDGYPVSSFCLQCFNLCDANLQIGLGGQNRGKGKVMIYCGIALDLNIQR